MTNSLAIVARPGSDEPSFHHVSSPPSPGPDDVLCRTLELGVCGTDREILHSLKPALPPGEDFLALGHECLAEIIEAGSRVQQYRAGDLVVPAVRRPLGVQSFRVDMLALGEFVERGIFHEHGFSCPTWLDRPEHLFRVKPSIASVAVLAEPVAVAEKGINEALVIQQARLDARVWTDPPPRVLVTGMGPIGFAAVLAARARSWPVTMAGRDAPDTFRAQLAQAFDANYRQLADEIPDAAFDGRYDLVLECTGSDQVMLSASRILAPRGVMVWLGSTRVPESKQHNVEQLMRDGIIRNHVHIGTVNSAPRDFVHALEHLEYWLERKPAELQKVITRRVSPREALWHYSHREPQGIKTIVEYPRGT
jgi:threonine dehydrogenase-like Zn-dependent dehydrogenase